MNKNKILHAEEVLPSTLSCETNPPRRILVVEDDGVIRRLNAQGVDGIRL